MPVETVLHNHVWIYGRRAESIDDYERQALRSELGADAVFGSVIPHNGELEALHLATGFEHLVVPAKLNDAQMQDILDLAAKYRVRILSYRGEEAGIETSPMGWRLHEMQADGSFKPVERRVA